MDLPLTGAYSTLEAANNNHSSIMHTSWMLAAKSDYRRIVATSQDGRVLIIDFGLRKELDNDGTPIEGVDLLREIPLENTNAIIFRNPFEESY